MQAHACTAAVAGSCEAWTWPTASCRLQRDTCVPPCLCPSAALPTSAALRCALRPQAARRAELLAAGKAGKEEKLAAARKAKAAARPGVKKVSKAFYNTMITDSGEGSRDGQQGDYFLFCYLVGAAAVGRGLDLWAGRSTRVRLD